MPDRGTIHVSQPLSIIATGYKNAEHIWPLVMKPVPVDKETDTFYIFGQEFLRYHGRVRPNKGPAQVVNSFSASTETYKCNEHSYKDILTDRDRNLCDPTIDPEARMTRNLQAIVSLDIEVDVAALVFGAGNYSGMTAAKTSANNWDADNPDGNPDLDVDIAKRTVQGQIGVMPNTMIVGAQVHDQLKRHPTLLEAYKYTGKGILTNDLIAAFFGLNYLVGEAIYITSKQGQTTITKDYIWGKSCAITYVPASAAIDEPAHGYTFLHKLFGGLTARTKKWRDEDNAGDAIETGRSYDPQVTAQKAGYLYTAVVD